MLIKRKSRLSDSHIKSRLFNVHNNAPATIRAEPIHKERPFQTHLKWFTAEKPAPTKFAHNLLYIHMNKQTLLEDTAHFSKATLVYPENAVTDCALSKILSAESNNEKR